MEALNPRGELPPLPGVLVGDARGLLPTAGPADGRGEASSPSMSSMKASIHSVSRSFIISSSPASGMASWAEQRVLVRSHHS